MTSLMIPAWNSGALVDKTTTRIAVTAIQPAAFTNLTIASALVGGGQAGALKGLHYLQLF